MKATELRIGNWIQYTNPHGDTVKMTVKKLYENNVDYNEPIPLTEEWLLKFGFEKTVGWDDFEYFKKDGVEFTDVTPHGYELCELEQCVVKHVHQLQNLYFALTGKELILK